MGATKGDRHRDLEHPVLMSRRGVVTMGFLSVLAGLLSSCGLVERGEPFDVGLPVGVVLEQPAALVLEVDSADITDEMRAQHREAVEQGLNPPPLRGAFIKPKEVSDAEHQESDFVLYESKAGKGIYKTDVWYAGQEGGLVWFEATEITEGRELSADTLRSVTEFVVRPSSGPLAERYGDATIKIYEGDWSFTYGAEFRLMFLADGSDTPVVLVSREYEINGWQH